MGVTHYHERVRQNPKKGIKGDVLGKLIDGKWTEKSIITSDADGNYDRQQRGFRDVIATDHETFTPESNRYHLFVSYACPWAHRTLIYRHLKDLTSHISISVVHPHMLANGWTFNKEFDGATGDTLFNNDYLYQIYQKADPRVSTSVTVPILWDKHNDTIVNNESSEIIRILNIAFNELTGNTADYYPEKHRTEIDQWNEKIYEPINNGVYKSGFATTQNAYEKAVTTLFNALDMVENHLGSHTYLVGETLTEADIRLITTLLRFDAVYHGHFKCNMKRIVDYPNLSRYVKRLWELPSIQETTHFDHIKQHYYYSHKEINPTRIVPVGPDVFI
jgi:putative glutathione S-transferase